MRGSLWNMAAGTVALLVAAGACGDGGTGPQPPVTIGPIGPFPNGLTGKMAFGTSSVIHSGSRAYTESKLHVIDIADPRDRVIFTGRDVFIEGLTWAPDGEHLVMQTYIWNVGMDTAIRQLHRLNVAVTQDQVIFDGPGPEYHPEYSGDGRLAYLAGWSTDPTSGLFIDGQSVYPQPWDANCHVAWSPSGAGLVYTSWSGLFYLHLSDHTLTQLVAAEGGEVLVYPAYSPDGSRIAFVRFGGTRNNQELWTVTSAGSDPRQLSAGFGDSHPQWTPNGMYLAFTRLSGSARGVYLIAPSGGTPTRIIGVSAPGVWPLAWSR
jgi:tricorn protease-like protein